MSRHRYRERKVVVPAACAAVLITGAAAVIAVPALAGTTGEGAGGPAVTTPGLLQAMSRDLDLPVDQARERLAAESEAARTFQGLRGTLGDSYAGTWFDDATGGLVVAVTDETAANTVADAGARPKVVRYDMAELARTKDRIDRMGTAVPDAVTSWRVEPRSNSVVVEVNSRERDAAADRFVRRLSGSAPAGRVERTASAPRPLADIVGGDPFTFGQGRCSIGFSATGPGGSEHFLTAGHCTESGGVATGADGQEIGPITESTFDQEGDFGLVDVTGAASRLTPLVNRYDGSTITVTGSTEALAGASICRSGSTTGFFCGEVVAFDQTVNYGNGDVVSGLTRTTVCAEPGDSGGAYISGTEAQGLTSGGSGDCTSGGVTFFQPVNEALAAFDLTLVTGESAAEGRGFRASW